MPLGGKKLHRFPVERHEDHPAKRSAFVGNNAIGKISPGFKKRQTGLNSKVIDLCVGDIL